MVSRHRSWFVGALALGASLVAAPFAAAAPEPSPVEVKAARQLFTEAERDEAAGRWREALEKFTQVVAFKETPSGLFHKAYCEERVGLPLAAYQDYKRAAQLNDRYASGNAADKKLIDQQTTSRMVALLPRIPLLKLRLPSGVEGVRVSFDDVELKPDELDVSRQVEPGQHIVDASAPDRPPFRARVTLTEGANEALSIIFAEPMPKPSGPTATAVRSPTPEEAPASSGRSVAIWAGAGASAALAATSVVFFLNGRSAADKLERECSRIDALCERSNLESARERNYLGAGIAGGLAAVGAGVTVWLALSGGSKATAPLQALIVSPHGVGFQGAF